MYGNSYHHSLVAVVVPDMHYVLQHILHLDPHTAAPQAQQEREAVLRQPEVVGALLQVGTLFTSPWVLTSAGIRLKVKYGK